ncbi:MAG: aldo/keto reductase [Micavibrio sp.]|nr:aldo/keto reductase [Micavibrio sp.]
MKYRTLGSSGLKVSDVCLGTMTWGEQNNEAEGHAQMDYAVEKGVNFFDTAELYSIPPRPETYGKTEEIVGSWFKNSGKRKDIILMTKVAGPNTAWIRNGEPLTSKSIKEAVEGSLQRLQTDYIDVYQLHWPNRPFPHFGRSHAGKIDFLANQTADVEDNLLDILEGVGEAVKEGKVRHFGLSDDSAWGITKYIELAKTHNLPRVTSIQNEFSLLNRSDDPYVAEVCVREDVAYLPWSPLVRGMISGKYRNGARPEGARWTVSEQLIKGFKEFRDTPLVHEAIDAYIKVAERFGLDVCQMALAFCKKQNFVTSTIIGATNMDQLTMNIAAFDLDLVPDVMNEIDRVYKQYPLLF